MGRPLTLGFHSKKNYPILLKGRKKNTQKQPARAMPFNRLLAKKCDSCPSLLQPTGLEHESCAHCCTTAWMSDTVPWAEKGPFHPSHSMILWKGYNSEVFLACQKRNSTSNKQQTKNVMHFSEQPFSETKNFTGTGTYWGLLRIENERERGSVYITRIHIYIIYK